MLPASAETLLPPDLLACSLSSKRVLGSRRRRLRRQWGPPAWDQALEVACQAWEACLPALPAWALAQAWQALLAWATSSSSSSSSWRRQWRWRRRPCRSRSRWAGLGWGPRWVDRAWACRRCRYVPRSLRRRRHLPVSSPTSFPKCSTDGMPQLLIHRWSRQALPGCRLLVCC